MSERKLASIQRILDIQPIEGADKIVRATINGWHLVTAIDNNFKVGDLVIYFEIDSWIPTEIAPFLSKGHEPREFEGVKGERLKTIKLRGQVSQGLIVPIHTVKYVKEPEPGTVIKEGDDVTEYLGVLKWEKALPANLQGKAMGYFPSFIHKTDQERCQNLVKEIEEAYWNKEEFEVTVKLDGSSMTVYSVNNTPLQEEPNIEVGVCSRNLELKLEGNEENAFVRTAFDTGLIDALKSLEFDIAVQGELYGEGVQGNNEGIKGLRFAVFDIFDISTASYLSPNGRYYVVERLIKAGAKIEHVEIIDKKYVLESNHVDYLLKHAEGLNAAGNQREGLVYKSLSRDFSFKAISNKFLLGEE
jgi:RNA ligase (TIGR02306 family)